MYVFISNNVINIDPSIVTLMQDINNSKLVGAERMRGYMGTLCTFLYKRKTAPKIKFVN